MNVLNLNQNEIQESRDFAMRIANQVSAWIEKHSTVSVERSILRLFGVDGINEIDVPMVNVMVDDICKHADIRNGASVYLASALSYHQLTLTGFIAKYQRKEISLVNVPLLTQEAAKKILMPYVVDRMRRLKDNRTQRDTFISKYPEPKTQKYVIVATGNIHEDVTQAKAAAKAGADIIAVIRSTGQSLLDFVPYGATTEGFGGTFATQENFKIMRRALDQVSNEEKRYIKLVNYASGLCMPEIAAMAAMERLDVLLNDSMYGIIFRDINMQRTFVDQYFSRLINAYSGIIINTGEDNYLTTSDAVEEAHTVLASQFINEAFALKSLLPRKLMGLGHAFEIDPTIENSFLYEVAQAEMARQIFPESPLKYMPPTKHITGNIFRAFEQNTLFNVATILTNQSIHLLGMMTEAIHTPFLSDRYNAIENAKMVYTTMASLRDEISFKEGGVVEQRAQFVLHRAHELLRDISQIGLFHALEEGVFAGIKRPYDGGKGLTGVIEKSPLYFNPFEDKMREELS